MYYLVDNVEPGGGLWRQKRDGLVGAPQTAEHRVEHLDDGQDVMADVVDRVSAAVDGDDVVGRGWGGRQCRPGR